MSATENIYCNPTYPTVDVPELDLLTLLFESEHCLAQDETVVHQSAEDPTKSLTKIQLRHLAQRVAHCLRHIFRTGRSDGDIVTVINSGQPMAPAVFFGVVAAGGIYSGASPSSTTDELVRQLRLVKSKVLICSIEFKDVAQKAAIQCGIALENVLLMGSESIWCLSSLSRIDLNLLSHERLNWTQIPDKSVLRRSPVAIVWSSGTTGVPKGVLLSHANLVAQTYITHLTGREAAARQLEEGTYVHHEFRTLAHLPSSHISGLFGYFISALYGGGLTIWMRKYEWKLFLQYVKQYQITYIFTVPSIYLRIAKSPDVTDQFSHLVAATAGSAPMDAGLQKSASARLGFRNGIVIGPGWGLSETTGGVTFTSVYDNDEIGSLGQILPALEVRLVNGDFEDVEDGHPGQLLVRGPTITIGYFNNAEATEEAFHHDWLCTGDIAIRRNAKLYMVDRMKELLKYKGVQIAPAELENLLYMHPKIQEAAVIGVPLPGDASSEIPRAYVVADSSKVTAEDIKDYVRDNLASYKQLRGGVVFVDEIPKNANGKIMRKELRERAKRELGNCSTVNASGNAHVSVKVTVKSCL